MMRMILLHAMMCFVQPVQCASACWSVHCIWCLHA